MPHKTRTEIAENTLAIDPQKLRVISPDVGGGFGMKGSPFPEHVMVALGSPTVQPAGALDRHKIGIAAVGLPRPRQCQPGATRAR